MVRSVVLILLVLILLATPCGALAQTSVPPTSTPTPTPTTTPTLTPTPTPSYIVVQDIDGERSLLLERTVTYGDIYVTGALLFLGLVEIFFHLLEIAVRWSR